MSYDLIPIPTCPRCGCAMYRGIQCMWPYPITLYQCHCGELMGELYAGADPPHEFVDNFSQLAMHGYLQVPR